MAFGFLFLLVWFLFCCCFETGHYYVAWVGVEPFVLLFSLLGDRITCVCHKVKTNTKNFKSLTIKTSPTLTSWHLECLNPLQEIMQSLNCSGLYFVLFGFHSVSEWRKSMSVFQFLGALHEVQG